MGFCGFLWVFGVFLKTNKLFLFFSNHRLSASLDVTGKTFSGRKPKDGEFWARFEHIDAFAATNFSEVVRGVVFGEVDCARHPAGAGFFVCVYFYEHFATFVRCGLQVAKKRDRR